jgi:hypothetical protein
VSGSYAYAQAGDYTATVQISDSDGAQASTSSSVAVADPALGASAGSLASVVEGQASGGTLATFADPGGAEPAANYSATVSWGDGAVTAGGISQVGGNLFAVTASHTYAGDGPWAVSVTVAEADNAGTAATVTTTANVLDPNPPQFSPIANQTSNEQSPVSLYVSAGDGDSDAPSYSAAGLPPGLSINPSSGQIYGPPTGQSAGSYSVTVYASDDGAVGQAGFSWQVLDVTTPGVSNPGNQLSAAGQSIALQLGATDADGDPLSYGAAGLPAGLGISSTGDISGTLGAASLGNYGVTVWATDGFNTGYASFSWRVVSSTPPSVTNPGPQSSNEQTSVALTIQGSDPDGLALSYSAVGLPPGLGINSSTGQISGTLTGQSAGSYSVTVWASDGPKSGSTTFAWTVHDVTTPSVTDLSSSGVWNSGQQVSLAGSDSDADPLSYAVASPPGHGSVSVVGSLATYTPASNYYGHDSFSYTAGDGFNTSSPATVALTVLRPPVAADDAYSTLHDHTLTVGASSGVLSNDSEFNGLTLSAVLVSGVQHGSLTLHGDGSFSYVPAAHFTGGDSFTYLASDGPLGSNIATVSLSVTDQPPTAQDQSYSVIQGNVLQVGAPGLLTGASDADSDPLSAVLLVGPAHGTLTLAADGSFSYKPKGGFFGTDTFTFAAYDGALDSPQATASIAVSPAPMLVHGSTVSATEGAADTLVVATLNDPLNAGTPDGYYSASIDWGDGTAAAGTVVVGAGTPLAVQGTHSYAEEGNYTLHVAVNDIAGQSATVTSQVNVADAPLSSPAVRLSAGPLSGVEGQAVSASFTVSDPQNQVSGNASIAWGDGSTSTAPVSGGAVQASHTYARAGDYPVSVSVSAAGQTVSSSTSAVISDAALTVFAGSVQVQAGQDFTGVLVTFRDADTAAPAGNYSATITWADGGGNPEAGSISSAGGGLWQVSGEHVFYPSGTFAARVVVSDTGGYRSEAALCTFTVLPAAQTSITLGCCRRVREYTWASRPGSRRLPRRPGWSSPPSTTPPPCRRPTTPP